MEIKVTVYKDCAIVTKITVNFDDYTSTTSIDKIEKFINNGCEIFSSNEWFIDMCNDNDSTTLIKLLRGLDLCTESERLKIQMLFENYLYNNTWNDTLAVIFEQNSCNELYNKISPYIETLNY